MALRAVSREISPTRQATILLARGGMGADEAPEIDDHRANVGHLPGGHPDDVPVTLRFQHRVKQVHVLLRERLGRGRFRSPPREDGQV
ncbi:MAG: hypothetical protein OXL68_18595 [Paracoccaceae bacterium]|nr:hypothetical protein [Paracoccaceae bacterium]